MPLPRFKVGDRILAPAWWPAKYKSTHLYKAIVIRVAYEPSLLEPEEYAVYVIKFTEELRPLPFPKEVAVINTGSPWNLDHYWGLALAKKDDVDTITEIADYILTEK